MHQPKVGGGINRVGRSPLAYTDDWVNRKGLPPDVVKNLRKTLKGTGGSFEKKNFWK